VLSGLREGTHPQQKTTICNIPKPRTLAIASRSIATLALAISVNISSTSEPHAKKSRGCTTAHTFEAGADASGVESAEDCRRKSSNCNAHTELTRTEIKLRNAGFRPRRHITHNADSKRIYIKTGSKNTNHSGVTTASPVLTPVLVA